MRILLDTNILTRLVEPGHAMHPDARDTTRALVTQGHTLCIVPQNLYEFWVVCTRPPASNGLGKSAVDAANELAGLRSLFALLDDSPALFPTWEQLVTANSVVGSKAHDTRLVAAMLIHGITHILTFNDADFRRYSGLAVLTPALVRTAPPTPHSPPPATPSS